MQLVSKYFTGVFELLAAPFGSFKTFAMAACSFLASLASASAFSEAVLKRLERC